MKTTILNTTVVSFFLLLIFTGFTIGREEFVSADEQVRDVAPFKEVSIAIPVHVTIEQGDPQELVINADESEREKIETKVTGGKLFIGLKHPFMNLREGVSVRITVPELEGISVAGSANVNIPSLFKADEMVLRISGSGEINFADLSSGQLESKIAGSGKLVLGGSAGNFESSIAGSGDVDAFQLIAEHFKGKISGSGKCMVNVTGELEASIAGSGSVLYKGHPKVNSSVAGSGKVVAQD